MNAFELLISQIDEEVGHKSTAICHGLARSFEEYTKLCGEVRGLLMAKELTEALKDKMENSDE